MAVAGVAATGGHAATRAKSTTLHLYTPYGANGRIARGVRVAKTVKGSCWTSSNVDLRSDAYRCIAGNHIYDPCFANEYGSGKYVLCPESAPASKVIRMHLTKKLPSNKGSSDPTRSSPWAMCLSSGRWCEIADGATSQIAGMSIDYYCSVGVLLGKLHRDSSAWTIFYAPSRSNDSYRTVTVRAAWW